MKEKNGDEMYEYGKILYKGIGSQSNKKEAIQYYYYYYSEMLEKGNGVAINKEESLKYLEKAANEGYTEALYKYALSFDNDLCNTLFFFL